LNRRRWGSGSLGGARKCRLKIKCFKVLPESCYRVVRDSQKRTLRGNEFQRLGADAQKDRESNRRLVRGTWNLKMTMISLCAIVGMRNFSSHIRRLSPERGWEFRIHVKVVSIGDHSFPQL